jgi:hypothetical protein
VCLIMRYVYANVEFTEHVNQNYVFWIQFDYYSNLISDFSNKKKIFTFRDQFKLRDG